MEGIKAIIYTVTQKKLPVFLCVSILMFVVSTSLAHAEGGITSSITSGINEIIFNVASTLGGLMTGLGGVLLDMALDQTVLKMGSWFLDGGIGGVINTVWTMLRDLFNIIFIFSLVYIGLRIIYDSDDSRTKKTLGLLIAAALLINFSLYIAKVVVDISNFTAVEIYSTATGGLTGTFGINTKDENGHIVDGFQTSEKSIAGAYMEVLNISSWFKDDLGNKPNAFVYSLFLFFFLGFLGVVFAYGAMMLVARFIAIIFYLMFSPLMFLGWVLPQFQKYTTQWWQGFIAYSFFAPVYIFMLYIGLFTLQQMKSEFAGNFSSGFLPGAGFTTSTMKVFLFYIIGTGFLYGAMKVASMMSSGGAAIGMNMADKISKRFTAGQAGSAVAGLGGGALGAVAGGSERIFGSTKMSRSLRGGRDKLRGMKIAGAASINESQKARTEGQAQVASDISAHSTRNAIKSGSPANANATHEQRVAYEKSIQNLKPKDAVNMAETSSGRRSLLDAAGDLSEQNIKAINEDKSVSVDFKKQLNDARKEGTVSTLGINASPATAATAAVPRSKAIQNIRKADKSQLKDMGIDNLMAGAKYLQDDQMKNLEDHIKDGALTKTQFTTLKEKRKADLINSKDTPAGARQILKTRKGSKDISKLPKEFLEHVNFIKAAMAENMLSVSLLNTIAREGDGINKTTIGNNVRRQMGAAAAPGTAIGEWFKSGLGLQFR